MADILKTIDLNPEQLIEANLARLGISADGAPVSTDVFTARVFKASVEIAGETRKLAKGLDIAKRLKSSPQRVSQALHRLEEAGRMVKTGAGCGTRYVPILPKGE